jgi:hypothetical protein
MHAMTATEQSCARQQERSERFRQGIRAISQSAEQLLRTLRGADPRSPALGILLAGLLKDLRQQRACSLDLAMGLPANAQFDAFITSMSTLRGTVAHWLTIHAAQPHTLQVEATDFEMQCFSTLGAGVMWLDSLQHGAERDSLISDEHLFNSLFGDQRAQAEDITDDVQQDWGEFKTQSGFLA